jgi:two-component system LytT family response regulator
MPSLRALIVDDEPLARERVRTLLAAEPDVVVAGECGSGGEAVAAILMDRPDLVFLDVQMPELDGFGVLERVREAGAELPAVVFVTAYDAHALRAFEVHALDYLLKPFDRERFTRALARAREALARREADGLDERLATLLAARSARPYATRLAVKSGGRVRLVKAEEVDWIEAASNYVRLHVGGERHLLRETMAALEARLDPERFVRIHRSTIVNLDRVRELEPYFHGDYVVKLHDGRRLTLSRTYRERLEERLGRAL